MAVELAVDVDTLGRVGIALADATRRHILRCLLEGLAYPAEVAEALGTSRSNVSNHLACLRGCGLVSARREGRHVRYEISDPRLSKALQMLATLRLSETDCSEHLGAVP